MQRSWIPGLIAAALLAATPAARADEVPAALANAVRERCEQRHLPAESTRLLLRSIARASAQGLPADSVADKILEGLAKGVDAARIAKAADETTSRLEAAQAVLREAGAEVPAGERRAALDRLALAVQAGGRDQLLGLAREAKGATPTDLLRAARQLGELSSRGVGPEAIPALAALARSGMGDSLERVAPLLDEYRAEGGEDTEGFLDEVRARAERRQGLDDLIDPFGDRPDPLRRIAKPGKDRTEEPGAEGKPGRGNAQGKPALEKHGRSGSAPGFDAESPARKIKDCSTKKNKAGCK